MPDLYSDLGLPPDASEAEIKAAYRKLSRAHHPDTGDGDREKFDRVQKANIILRDPDRRKKYDETGDASAEPDNTQAEVASLLGAAFEQAYSDCLNPDRVDLIDKVRRVFGVMRQSIAANTESATQAKTKAEKAASRLKTSAAFLSTPFLEMILRDKISDAEKSLAKLTKMLENLELAEALLEGYSYEVDTSSPSQPAPPSWLLNPSSAF